MMKFIIGSLLFVFLTGSYSTGAAPFIVTDPEPTGTATRCVFQEGTNPSQETLTVGAACHIDIATFFSFGNHTVTLWFRAVSGGTNGLLSAPFTFTRENPALAAPTNPRIEPQ